MKPSELVLPENHNSLREFLELASNQQTNKQLPKLSNRMRSIYETTTKPIRNRKRSFSATPRQWDLSRHRRNRRETQLAGADAAITGARRIARYKHEANDGAGAAMQAARDKTT